MVLAAEYPKTEMLPLGEDILPPALTKGRKARQGLPRGQACWARDEIAKVFRKRMLAQPQGLSSQMSSLENLWRTMRERHG